MLTGLAGSLAEWLAGMLARLLACWLAGLLDCLAGWLAGASRPEIALGDHTISSRNGFVSAHDIPVTSYIDSRVSVLCSLFRVRLVRDNALTNICMFCESCPSQPYSPVGRVPRGHQHVVMPWWNINVHSGISNSKVGNIIPRRISPFPASTSIYKGIHKGEGAVVEAAEGRILIWMGRHWTHNFR